MLTAELDACAIALLVRARELSPVEVVEAHLERLEDANPQLNAIVTVRADEARREARAVAAGSVPLTLAGDFGGSLRWPAHCTGIVALRPTVGRVPGTGQVPARGSVSLQGRLSVLGPLARSVGDLELALGVLAG